MRLKISKISNLRQAGQDDGSSGQMCWGGGRFLAGSCDGLRTAVRIPCGIASRLCWAIPLLFPGKEDQGEKLSFIGRNKQARG